MNDTFSLSLRLMGQGMAGIFAVILIIYVVLLFLGKPKNTEKGGVKKEEDTK
jgi:Na+-transporting methylmalonyl-CoA/oxaloacetate decarboxylase gamma subunit